MRQLMIGTLLGMLLFSGQSLAQDKGDKKDDKPRVEENRKRRGERGRRDKSLEDRANRQLERMKDGLKLTAEQESKLRKILIKSATAKAEQEKALREVLSAEQLRLYESQRRNRGGKRGRDGTRGEDGKRRDRGKDRERDARQGRRQKATPEQQIATRSGEAVKELGLPAEETAVLSPLIGKVVRYQITTRTRVRALRDEIGKLAGSKDLDEAALKAKLAELRKLREAARTRLASLRQGLQELLTFEQKARLVALGILE